MQENKPILIVGLGNPGKEYDNTRHNVGFMTVDFLAGRDAVWKKEKNALIFKSSIIHHPSSIIFAKPQTFMNNSGIAVRELMTFYKIPLENLIVIHDDLDLPVGKMREKIGGGSAGHNGIKSIDANVGQEYMRVRIGIGHPRDLIPRASVGGNAGRAGGNEKNVSDWVLGKIPPDELKEIDSVIKSMKIID